MALISYEQDDGHNDVAEDYYTIIMYIERYGDKKMRIENEDYEVDWGNNLFSLYQAAIFKPTRKAEPVLLNVYGAPALIPRNEFRQTM